jgi:hypothetical protein
MALVKEDAVDNAFDRFIYGSIIKDYIGTLATELERCLLVG